MSQITTRRLTTADVNKLQQISIETFKDTFGAQTPLKIWPHTYKMHITCPS
ncbi:hypothetical protein TUA1478L_29990 [Lactiplantibacillus plantarum]